MKSLRDISIRQKLTGVILVTSLTVLLSACLTLAFLEAASFRRSMVQEMIVLADVLGRSNAVAIFMDQGQDDATEKLAMLAANRHIVCARLFTKEGHPFADYVRPGAPADLPSAPPVDGPQFESDYLSLSQPVMKGGERVGTLYLRADLAGMYERLRAYAMVVAIVVAGAILLILILSYLLQRVISQPILALAGTARAVAERKDYSVRAVKQGSDEIGLLTDAVNQLLGEIEAGHGALRQTVGVLGSSSHEILSLSAQLAASATQTATSVSETTTTVEEVRHTTLIASQKTRQVSESSQRVADIAQSGKKSTEETIGGINRIREQMQSIALSMVRLTEQTRTIGNIIASVEDLAQQSNLLAVNAAIEAAKAGEQGKGFSVVAIEVRNLAEQSRTATAQVRAILGDVQRATGAAVMATEQGTKAVEAGVRQSEQAGQSILSLAGAVEEAAQAAAQIAASSQQQLAGMEQVAGAMESIKKASAQNADNAGELTTAARTLEAVGQRLKVLVGHLKHDEAGSSNRVALSRAQPVIR